MANGAVRVTAVETAVNLAVRGITERWGLESPSNVALGGIGLLSGFLSWLMKPSRRLITVMPIVVTVLTVVARRRRHAKRGRGRGRERTVGHVRA